MSDQKIQAENRPSEPVSSFLPDPNEIPRTIFWSVCLLAYATLLGLIAGNADFRFVVGLGAACGLGVHRIAVRRDWTLRSKIPRR
jgi:hypothetical protein